MRPELDVILVHYHAAEAAARAVAALGREARRDELACRVLIADNGSTALERDLLRSTGAAIIEVGRNAGYAGAVNAAFPRTTAGAIVVMNEDVIVLPGCLRALHDALASGVAIAGPEFFWDAERRFRLPPTEERTRRNELLKLGARRGVAPLRRARSAWRAHARRHWRSAGPLPSTSLSGALLAFRRDAWSAIGPFDDGFHLYFEENDWLLRAAGAGLAVWYVPAAKAIHLHDPTRGASSERSRWQAESFARFGRRHYGERFMRRLLVAAGRERFTPDWPSFDSVAGAFVADDATWPVWIEVSPDRSGFPAATATVCDAAAWDRAASCFEGVRGAPFVLAVDDAGRELFGCEVGPGRGRPAQYRGLSRVLEPAR